MTTIFEKKGKINEQYFSNESRVEMLHLNLNSHKMLHEHPHFSYLPPILGITHFDKPTGDVSNRCIQASIPATEF